MDERHILSLGDYPNGDAAAMDQDFAVHHGSPDALPVDEAGLIRAIAFKGHGTMTDALMACLPNLGLIANFGVGYDTIDVPAATARGIKVTNTPDVLTDDVADLAVGMLLAHSRHLVQAEAWVRQGNWAARGDYPLQRKVTGKRVGIVGLGRIGRSIADRLDAFSMEISYTSRQPKDTPGTWRFVADPVQLAADVDYLVVALAGGPETAGTINAKVISALGPKGVLVNISRGSNVDEEALIQALASGTLGGAALDVFASEPDPDPRLLRFDNVLLQPHQASATVETRQAMGQLQRDNMAAFFNGSPLITPVN